MYRQAQPIFLSVLLAFAVGGCQKKRSGSPGAPMSPPIAVDTAANEEAAHRQAVADVYARRATLEAEFTNSTTPLARIKESLREIAPIALHRPALLDPKRLDDAKFTTIRSVYLGGLERYVARSANAALVDDAEVKRFEEILRDGCADGECTFAKALVADPRVSLIMIRLADVSEGVIIAHLAWRKNQRGDAPRGGSLCDALGRFYGNLEIANARLNRSADLELSLRYVRYSIDDEACLAQRSAAKLPGTAEARELSEKGSQHRNFLNISIAKLRSSSDPRALDTYCSFLAENAPYETDFRGLGSDVDTKRRLLSALFMCPKIVHYINDKDGAFRTSLKRRTDTLRSEAEHYLPAVHEKTQLLMIPDDNIALAVKELAEDPHIAAGLDINLNVDLDAIELHIVDRLYHGRIEPGIAENFVARLATVDDEKFLALAENYVKIQIAYLLKFTYINMGRAFAAEAVHGPDTFKHVLDKVNNSTRRRWTELKEQRVRNVLTFISNYYGAKYYVGSPSSPAKDRYNQLRVQLEQIETHLSYVVAAPLMVGMYYYMSKLDGQIPVEIDWIKTTDNVIRIDASSALSGFFGDGVSAASVFFDFGKRTYRLSALQRQHAFDFALRTGLFDYFPMDLRKADQDRRKIQGKDEKETARLNAEYLLYREYIKRALVVPHEGGLRRNIDYASRLARAGGRGFLQQFKDACANPLAAPLRFPINKLMYETLMADETYIEMVLGVYSGFQGLRGYDYVEKSIKDVEDLTTILKKHYYGPGAEKRLNPSVLANRDKIIAAIEAEAQPIEQLKRDWVRNINDLDKVIVSPTSNCLSILAKAENYRRQQLYLAAMDHFKDVHAGMTLLRAIPEDTQVANDQTIGRQDLESIAAQWLAQAGDTKSKEDIAARIDRIISGIVVVSARAVRSGEEALKMRPLKSRVEEAVNALFEIHNNLENETYEHQGTNYAIGYMVTGREVKGVELRKHSYISRDRYVQGKWDTYARIRRELQTLRVPAADAAKAIGLASASEIEGLAGKDIPLAPRTDVTIDRIVDDVHSVYHDIKTADLNFRANQDEFINDALAQFSGDARNGTQFVNWYTGSGDRLNLMDSRRAFLESMFSSGGIDITEGGASCQRDMWNNPRKGGKQCELISGSAADVVKAHLEILDHANLEHSPVDRQIVEAIGSPGPYQSRVDKMLQYRTTDTHDWTYFDTFYRRFVKRPTTSAKGEHIELDQLRGSHLVTELLAEKLEHFDRGQHLFNLSQHLITFQRLGARRSMFSHLEQVWDIEDAIMALENAETKLPDVLVAYSGSRSKPTSLYKHDDKWQYVSVANRTEGPRAGTPLLLRDDIDSSKVWFRTYLRSLIITDTKCSALPEPDDADFAAGTKFTPGEACEDRYQRWEKAQKIRRCQQKAIDQSGQEVAGDPCDN